MTELEMSDIRRRPVREFQPIAPLGGWIVSIQGGVPPARRLILAHDGSAIVFRRLRTEGGARVSLHAIGPTTYPVQKDLGEVLETVIVRFRPGHAREIFGAPIREFVCERVTLTDCWSREGSDLGKELAEERSLAKCVERIQRALICRLEKGRHRAVSTAELACKFSEALAARVEREQLWRVTDVAGALGLSSRQLQRTCLELFGLPPKTYLQLRRFQFAVRMAKRGLLPDWADIAVRAGYFDQAHLIAAFKRFAGRTPASLLRDSTELALVN